ncbi:MAG: putative manganese-dependent inorganic diphosphatase [Sphaerochaetaceae bacterium]|nr:putative manganese-dependent inorganic diphosphatase [Sphaerochaetaceae bacterium]
MSEVYITGHRNPDMDSICAAYAYAALKNMTDRVNHYTAVRCGHLSDSVKGQFSILGIEPPPYMLDVNPKVQDVMRTDDVKVDSNAPIYDLIKIYHQTKPSAVPLFDGDRFCGLLSIDDIASWFLNDNVGSYPLYTFSLDNIEKVLPCTVVKRGSIDNFTSPILAGASHVEEHPDAVVVMPYGKRYVASAMSCNVPAIVITDYTGKIDLDMSAYKGSIYISNLDTSETLRRLKMASPVYTLLREQGPIVQKTDLFDEAKELLAPSRFRGLAVYEGDRYVGFVTRRCFLKKPKHNVILVDHNEPSQSIRGVESARILEIIDHHRLDAPKTDLPIFIDAEPLGSTCTIIYQLFVRNNVVPDLITSKVLLAGILADTIALRSPTTTGIDIWSAERLAPLAGISDVKEFGRRMFENVGSLGDKDPETVISSDFKVYHENGMGIGIGQCEVPTLNDSNDYVDKYLVAINKVREINHLDWVMLMITDVLKGRSILLTSGHKLESKFSYTVIKDRVFDMHDAVSRKKQLLPEVIQAVNG